MFEAAELDLKLSKHEFDEQAPSVREALLEGQAQLRESPEFSVAIVIAGAEGAGKGETVNTLLAWMDARGIQSHAMGSPSSEDTERPDFYRYWRRLPAKGQIAIFFGSWYTFPVVERSFGRIDEPHFDRKLSRIVDFERMLAAENVLLLKLWLHITKKQQRRRFEKLSKDPDTAWRVTPQDWEYHETYEPFVEASAHALRRTSTGLNPWEIIPARDRRYRELTVATKLLERLDKRLEQSPRPQPQPQPLPKPAAANVINALDLSPKLAKKTYEKKLSTYQARVGRLARRMHAAGGSAVIVFEGCDAAGKGGCIRRVITTLDSRFYRVIPIAAPTDEEKARPYLWRFWRHVPRRGHIAIFDRSWYGRVLVERIEGLCAPADWQRAYGEINAFEDQLIDAGTLVFKFWLAITKEEQLRRFEEREATGFKRYKITDEDWRNRERWPAYEAAACEMVEQTSTEIAPWHLVSAEDKYWARVEVLKTISDGLEKHFGPDEDPKSKHKKRKNK